MASLNGLAARRKQQLRRNNINIEDEQSKPATPASRRPSTGGTKKRAGVLRPVSASHPKPKSRSSMGASHSQRSMFPPLPSKVETDQLVAEESLNPDDEQGPSMTGRSDVTDASTALLLDTLTNRISHWEKTVKQLRSEVVSKEKALIEANQCLEESETELHSVLEENKQLRSQISEMEAFLSDYGLVWVGSHQEPRTPGRRTSSGGGGRPRSSTGGSAGSGKGGEPRPRPSTLRGGGRLQGGGRRAPLLLPPPPIEAFPTGDGQGGGSTDAFAPEFDVLIKQIQELNILMEADKAQIVTNKAGTQAKLEFQKGISLALYADGIVIENGSFRPYSEPRTQTFVKDLMDGYFPDEFKADYPDGIVIHVDDKRFVEESAGFLPFSGQGNFLCSPDSRVVNIKSRESSNAVAGVASSLADYGDSDFQLLYTPALKDIQAACTQIEEESRAALAEGPGSPSPRRSVEALTGPLTTLRVRFDGGGGGGDDGGAPPRPVVLKMHFEDTIGHLRLQVDKYLRGAAADSGGRRRRRGSSSSSSSFYELRTPFPNRAYGDPAETLAAAGLVPNATLVVRWRRRR